MILSFRDQATEDVFNGRDTKPARRICPAVLWAVARRKLDQLNAAVALVDLRAPPANRLEVLKGNRRGQHSIRINDQYRVCFRWTPEGPEHVEIVDYH
jgi:proteic killer suppression protein